MTPVKAAIADVKAAIAVGSRLTDADCVSGVIKMCAHIQTGEIV